MHKFTTGLPLAESECKADEVLRREALDKAVARRMAAPSQDYYRVPTDTDRALAARIMGETDEG